MGRFTAKTVTWRERCKIRRYWKGILGGFLAVLAAFGWVIAIMFVLMLKGVVSVVGLARGVPLWVLLTLIFAVGFYLAFRASYERKISR